MAQTVKQLREEIFELQKQVVRLETLLETNQERMEEKEKQCDDFREQVLKLQDALVAKESPDAYMDRRNAEEKEELTPEQREEIQYQKELAVINRRVLDGMTDPTFKDADDMIAMLTQASGPPESKSLHGNEEG